MKDNLKCLIEYLENEDKDSYLINFAIGYIREDFRRDGDFDCKSSDVIKILEIIESSIKNLRLS